jgi:hypothetical protein
LASLGVAADPRRFKHRQRPDCKGEAVNGGRRLHG